MLSLARQSWEVGNVVLQVILGVGALPLAWGMAGWVTGSMGLGAEYEVWRVPLLICESCLSPAAISEYGVCGDSYHLLRSHQPSMEYLLHFCTGRSPWFQSAGEVMMTSLLINSTDCLPTDTSVLREGPAEESTAAAAANSSHIPRPPLHHPDWGEELLHLCLALPCRCHFCKSLATVAEAVVR